MVILVVILLVIWLIVAIVGFALKGLLWIAIIGIVLFVATGITLSALWMRHQNRRRERDLQLAAATNQ